MEAVEQDNWYKRRRYGYGFTPVTWQGWLLVGLMILLLVIPAFFLGQSSNEIVIGYLIYVVVVLSASFYVMLSRSPKPKWRWGKSDHDNPDEDL